MSNSLARDLDHVLEHTRDLWDELRGGRIFITGGTGFFGCWLLESLLWADERLGLNMRAVVLSRDPEGFVRKAPHLARGIELVRGDVRSFGFPSGEFSHVIHAAADTVGGCDTESRLRMLETIIGGTRRTLDFAVHCGAKRVLLTSSGAVYGRQPPDVTHVPEEFAGAPCPTDCRSAYGEGKRAAELICALYAQRYDIETKIARCFAFVGPHMALDAHFAIGNFIRDAMSGGPVIVGGDGTPYRSYLYAADLATWLWTILLRGQNTRPYNVGSDEEITIGSLARRVAGPDMEVVISREPVDGAQAERYVPSTDRARDELGLKQHIGLDDAIRRTMQYYTEVDTWRK